MKELCYTILSKPVAQEFINCWFSYLLAQPVDFDLPVLLYFLMQYFGVMKVFQLFEKGKEYLHASKQRHFDSALNDQGMISPREIPVRQ